MPSRQQGRDTRFEVVDNHLVRTVTFPNGKSYQHRCTEEVFTDVAYAIDASPTEGEGLTLRSLAESLDLPFTQVNVAMEFLTERGVLDVRHRRSYRASHCAFEDAMCEYHALAEARRAGR